MWLLIMLSCKDVKLFLNEPVKLVKKNEFVLYGYIRKVSSDSLIFESTEGVRSVIVLEAVKEIVERSNKKERLL